MARATVWQITLGEGYSDANYVERGLWYGKTRFGDTTVQENTACGRISTVNHDLEKHLYRRTRLEEASVL